MDVGLQGMEAQEAQVGKIIFQGMKFSETSYKHEVYLLIYLGFKI